MEARGFFEDEGELTLVPAIRVGVAFGHDRVAATTCVVDTGSDVCVFPDSLLPWTIPERAEPDTWLEFAGGEGVPVTLRYPSITAGELREALVASVFLPDAPSILGRSFLNRFALAMAAPRDLVQIRSAARDDGRD